MSFTRESTAKDILEGGRGFFKRHSPKPDEEAVPETAPLAADPYGHVDSGRPGAAIKNRDFSKSPAAGLSDDGKSPEVTTYIRRGDPLAEVYRVLREHGGVAFGAQREDGSWELTPLEPLHSDLIAMAEQKKPSSWQESLSPQTQAELAAALEKFAPKS